MPFDNARSYEAGEADAPAFHRIETAISAFCSNHPYLLFDRTALAHIRHAAAANPKLKARLARVMREPAPAADPQAVRAVIKRQARRLINLSFIALIAEDDRRDDALAASRSALAAFASAKSWKERHVIKSFLDCAEIAVAVALAYDWLYDRLSVKERRDIERAILRNVLEPALSAYQDPSVLWPDRRDNCTLVSNAGIAIAALAVLCRHRALSSRVVQSALASAWNVFAAFGPDGAWPEGLSYWALTVRYAGLIIAGLESTLGDSFGLADRPGFGTTGDFALHAAGPFGAAFNFGDSELRFDVSPLAFLAHRFGRPIDGWLIGDYDGWQLPFTAIWPERARAGPAALGLPTGKVFGGGGLACFRNTWDDDAKARPVYLAIKGGNGGGGGSALPVQHTDLILHAQADAGTFVVDGARHRWVVDLGSDDYDLPGYFDHGADYRSGPRWQYYRAQTAGHNTLVIDGTNQVPNNPATILGSCVEGACKWVVFDLSPVYGRPRGTIRRGAALIGRQVVIEDEIAAGVSTDIVWTMHTCAEPVSVTGTVARFRIGGERFLARILEPATARFELTLPPPPRSFVLADPSQRHGRLTAGDGARVCELPRRDDNGGERAAGAVIRRLQIVWPAGVRRLTVLLLPDCGDDDVLPLPVTSLDTWLDRRPVRLARYPGPEY